MLDLEDFQTRRYRLRRLTPDDASRRYLSWFSDDGAEHIVSATRMRQLDDLRDYIRTKAACDDVLFLGIFRVSDGVHIGNVKFEPLDPVKGYAVVGILVGDSDSRGQGVAGEVLTGCAEWLKTRLSIGQFVLGVDETNAAAIRAYEKTGFKVCKTEFLPKTEPGVLTMKWSF